MANYFVSYDLNGSHPTHAAMDAHLKKLGPCVLRVVETVWFVSYSGTLEMLYQYVNGFVSPNDRVLIIDARDCHFRNLLVPNETLQKCWRT